MVTEIRKVKI